jgi:hypothetical protein
MIEAAGLRLLSDKQEAIVEPHNGRPSEAIFEWVVAERPVR